MFAEEERDYFTQQEYLEFNNWCLNITDNPASKCTETADLVRFSINDAGYAKVDEACLVWEMQRDLIGFGLYNSWDCIEECSRPIVGVGLRPTGQRARRTPISATCTAPPV